MANSAQARKRARQTVKQRDHNTSLRSQLRTAIKHVRKAVGTADKTTAQAAFKASIGAIDSIADKGIIHKNKAARHKSRLSAAIKAMARPVNHPKRSPCHGLIIFLCFSSSIFAGLILCPLGRALAESQRKASGL